MPSSLDETFRIDPANLPAESVIFGSTPAMREIRSKIDSVLSNDLPVLIQGENGTGVEVVARFLHTRSNRRDAPFVKLSCVAAPAALLESELFGCQRESRPGVCEDRPGLVEIAAGGTLFIDEIGKMSWKLQGKLLRLLENSSYSRIGGREERIGRIRVVCATNVDLREAVKTGVFRADLFHRIDVVCLRLSPLRDRRNDIPQLSEYFLQKLSRQFQRSIPRPNPATLHLMKQWAWPGNMLELKNWIARAIILGGYESLSAELRQQVKSAHRVGVKRPDIYNFKDFSPRRPSTAAATAIVQVLRANHWDPRKAARKLKMSYRTLLGGLRLAGGARRRRGHRGFPHSQ
jgi:two-component system, NtrC family, response regulator AtoC